MKVTIFDYGAGNLHSLAKSLEGEGVTVQVETDPARAVRDTDALVLPGVGAFGSAAERLAPGREAMRAAILAGLPTIGICLGMQLLFDSSTELGGAEGLGLLEGPVRELDAQGRKVPQIGWNEVTWREGSPLSEGLPERTAMYHVHSFAARPSDAAVVAGTATYGEEFVSAVARGNTFGVQFHPEKSSTHGLALLANFVKLTECRPAVCGLRSAVS